MGLIWEGAFFLAGVERLLYVLYCHAPNSTIQTVGGIVLVDKGAAAIGLVDATQLHASLVDQMGNALQQF